MVAEMVGWRECCLLVAGSTMGGEWWRLEPRKESSPAGVSDTHLLLKVQLGLMRPVITVSPGALGDSRACGRWGGSGG